MGKMFLETTIQAGLCGDLAWFSHHLQPSLHRAAQYPLAIAMKGGPEKLRETPRLTVGTIHSVKGGEADIVYLFPDLSPAAAKLWIRGHRTQAPIYRQFYVGMTRARETLVLCSPSRRHRLRF